ncbi:MAG: sugar ABC transporter substrate-binding protein [Nitrospirae bacterium]|nr:sugar ABC transporter substrate-binding protein [Nitrospirota bacterium]
MRQPGLPASFVSGFHLILLVLLALPLVGCAVAPTASSEAVTHAQINLPAQRTKAILEKIQKDHPEYIIRALLKQKGRGTEIHLTIYTPRTVHMVVQGFQEPSNGKKLYPDCNHWFDLTRSFDPACGGGPYLGTANLVFGDGMALGLMFDLFQAARYPFTYTKANLPDEEATKSVLKSLKSAEKLTDAQGPALLASRPPLP